MKRFESNQSRIKQYRTGFVVLYILQDLIAGGKISAQSHSFIYYGYTTHVDQVYRKQYIRNIVKILLSRGRHVHLKTHKQKKKKTVWMKMLREILLGISNRSLSCKGPEYQRLFFFELNSASGNGLQFRSI